MPHRAGRSTSGAGRRRPVDGGRSTAGGSTSGRSTSGGAVDGRRSTSGRAGHEGGGRNARPCLRSTSGGRRRGRWPSSRRRSKGWGPRWTPCGDCAATTPRRSTPSTRRCGCRTAGTGDLALMKRPRLTMYNLIRHPNPHRQFLGPCPARPAGPRAGVARGGAGGAGQPARGDGRGRPDAGRNWQNLRGSGRPPTSQNFTKFPASRGPFRASGRATPERCCQPPRAVLPTPERCC